MMEVLYMIGVSTLYVCHFPVALCHIRLCCYWMVLGTKDDIAWHFADGS